MIYHRNLLPLTWLRSPLPKRLVRVVNAHATFSIMLFQGRGVSDVAVYDYRDIAAYSPQSSYVAGASVALYSHGLRRPRYKEYKCAFCNRQFTKKSVLDNHLMIHTGKRPFGCSLCDYVSIQKRCVLIHLIRTHHIPPGSESQYVRHLHT